MNITRENKDALNAVVTIAIEKEDYAEKVEKTLTDYRKSANIPGFRKGQVPMGLVKKQEKPFEIRQSYSLVRPIF